MPRAYSLCKSCDLIVELQEYKKKVKCTCPQCNSLLRSGNKVEIKTSAIVGLAALILLIVTVANPFVTISAMGIKNSVSMHDMVTTLEADWTLLLIIFFAFTLIFPIVMILMQIAAGIFGHKPTVGMAFLYKFVHKSCFVDVMILGLLVSLIKLTTMTTIEFHSGFFMGLFFSFVCIWCWVKVQPEDYWELIMPSKLDQRTRTGATGAEQGYIMCRHCDMVYRSKKHEVCPRCSRRNGVRYEMSVQKTAAFLLAAVILYLPSNVYPIMFTNYMGNNIGSNIIDGVIALWNMDSYFVALVILIASIFIPIFKIASLVYLLIRIKYHKHIDKAKLSHYYRFVEFIGKWSMIDVFVVIIMSSSVRMGGMLTIAPGFAIVIFCAVVIITMFAASSFDERLIWDIET